MQIQGTKESVGEWSKIVVMDFLTRLESLNLSFGLVDENPFEFHLPLNLKKVDFEEISMEYNFHNSKTS